MSEQLDHVERPMPPWRTERATECGLDQRHPMISRREFYERVKAQGKQRAAMSICMTCWSTAERHAGYGYTSHAELVAAFEQGWESDPVAVIGRDVYGKHRDLLAAELRATALLVAAHRAEFDEAMVGMAVAPSLAERRSSKAAERRYGRGSRR